MISVSDILKSIDYLPAFNQTVHKALQLIQKDTYSNKELADIIKFDASLTANILKISNSALYAKSNKIHDIGTALSFLGKQQLFSLLSIVATKQYFSNTISGYEINAGELWNHNLSVAVLTESLAYYEKDVDKSILFTAGLLHDIGKIILNTWVQSEWQRIMDLVEKESYDFISAEKKILGYTHAHIGGAILKQWNLPLPIINAAKHHHDESLFDDPVVRLVCLADFLTFAMGYMTQMDNMYMSGYAKVLEYYHIKTKEIEVLISNNFEKVTKTIQEFNLNP